MRGFRLARIAGVDVVADASLVVLALLLSWSIYLRLEDAYPRLGGTALTVVSIAGGVLFIASIVAHELSHSVVALRRGLPVRRIRLFIFGGVSEIEDDARSPGEEFVVAFAGPLASAATGVALWLLGTALPGAWDAAASMLRLMGVINLALAGFNLLPGLPLDGGRVLHAAIWQRRNDREAATRIAVGAGRALGVAIAAAGTALLFLRNDLTGVWLVAIGWFLAQAAASTQLRERLLAKVEGLAVSDVMRPVDVAVAGESSIEDVLDLHAWGERLRSLPVVVEGRVRGVIGMREIAAVGKEQRAATQASEAMTPIGPRDVVDADMTLVDFLGRDPGTAKRVIATSRNRVVGIVSADELRSFLE